MSVYLLCNVLCCPTKVIIDDEKHTSYAVRVTWSSCCAVRAVRLFIKYTADAYIPVIYQINLVCHECMKYFVGILHIYTLYVKYAILWTHFKSVTALGNPTR